MRYTILDEDAEGVSHFQEADFLLEDTHFAPPAAPMLLSEKIPASALVALTLPAGWVGVPHNSPLEQVAFILRGQFRVEAGDGEVRDFGPGDIFWMKDVSGGGHGSRAMNGEPVDMMVVQFPTGG
ncbi:hypothetical protein AB0T83_06635 [Fluviibacterium sp. DFM31]|uniref:Cupin domain-containing protein n=1 Tax=Meridianimarinicoccus marinus TaxID=3231483 RepID=A0ABV3L4L0_9RHOB